MMSVGTAAADNMQVTYAKELLEITGLQHWVDDLEKILHQGVTHRKNERGGGKELYIKAEQALQNHLSKEALLEAIAGELVKGYDARRYLMLRRLANSPPYKKMLNLRLAVRSEEAQKAIKDLASRHKDEPIPKSRTELLQQLDASSGETEFFIAIQSLSIATILEMFEKIQPVFDQSLYRAATQLELTSRYESSMTLRYAYQEIPDEELKQFVSLYQNAVMGWFHMKTLEAMVEAVKKASSQAREVM